jgi:predicted kinase
VAALIHLNGPPGIGKSTLAELYVDRHPGALNLDTDALHHFIGGWRHVDGRTHDIVRPLALAMATAHLRGGRDVVLPHYLGTVAEIETFEAVAAEQRADFYEIVLLADRTEAIDRFIRRQPDSDWHRHNRDVVAHHGGDDFLAGLYDQLLEIVRLRPSAMVLRSEPDAIAEAYAALAEALDEVVRREGIEPPTR